MPDCRRRLAFRVKARLCPTRAGRSPLGRHTKTIPECASPAPLKASPVAGSWTRRCAALCGRSVRWRRRNALMLWRAVAPGSCSRGGLESEADLTKSAPALGRYRMAHLARCFGAAPTFDRRSRKYAAAIVRRRGAPGTRRYGARFEVVEPGYWGVRTCRPLNSKLLTLAFATRSRQPFPPSFPAAGCPQEAAEVR